MLRRKPKPTLSGMWAPDSDAVDCRSCGTKFTGIRRRHHCRACGQLFCGSCTAGRAVLPSLQAKPVRVCTACAAKHGGSGADDGGGGDGGDAAAAVSSDSDAGTPHAGAAGGSVRRSVVGEWVRDGAVEACPLCVSAFNPTRRRHHCRSCGAVVCGSCSRSRASFGCVAAARGGATSGAGGAVASPTSVASPTGGSGGTGAEPATPTSPLSPTSVASPTAVSHSHRVCDACVRCGSVAVTNAVAEAFAGEGFVTTLPAALLAHNTFRAIGRSDDTRKAVMTALREHSFAFVVTSEWMGEPGAGKGQFMQPVAACVPADGKLAVVDSVTETLSRWNLATGGCQATSALASYGSTPRAVAAMHSPDAGSRVMYLDATPPATVTMLQPGSFTGELLKKFTGAATGLCDPHGVETTRHDTVVVADTGNDRVCEFTPAGTLVRVVGTGVVQAPAALTSPVAGGESKTFTRNSRGATAAQSPGTAADPPSPPAGSGAGGDGAGSGAGSGAGGAPSPAAAADGDEWRAVQPIAVTVLTSVDSVAVVCRDSPYVRLFSRHGQFLRMLGPWPAARVAGSGSPVGPGPALVSPVCIASSRDDNRIYVGDRGGGSRGPFVAVFSGRGDFLAACALPDGFVPTAVCVGRNIRPVTATSDNGLCLPLPYRVYVCDGASKRIARLETSGDMAYAEWEAAVAKAKDSR